MTTLKDAWRSGCSSESEQKESEPVPSYSDADFQGIIERAIKDAADILRENGFRGEWEAYFHGSEEDFSKYMSLIGLLSPKNTENEPVQLQWAVEVFRTAVFTQIAFADMKNKQNDGAIRFAMSLARLVQQSERAGFACVLPDIERGKKSVDGAKLGHEMVHGTIEEKLARWEKYQADLEQAHIDHPTWGIMALRETVAELNGVSTKTIQTHTSKTW